MRERSSGFFSFPEGEKEGVIPEPKRKLLSENLKLEGDMFTLERSCFEYLISKIPLIENKGNRKE